MGFSFFDRMTTAQVENFEVDQDRNQAVGDILRAFGCPKCDRTLTMVVNPDNCLFMSVLRSDSHLETDLLCKT